MDVARGPFDKAVIDIDPKPQPGDSPSMLGKRAEARELDRRVQEENERRAEEDDAVAEAADLNSELSSPAAQPVTSVDSGPPEDVARASVDRAAKRLGSVVKDYILSAQDDVFVHKRSGIFLTPRAFLNQFRSVMPHKSIELLVDSDWFADNVFVGTTLLPGEPPVIATAHGRRFNLSFGPGFAPLPGNVAPFEDMLGEVADGNHDVAQELAKFLAWIAQRPKERLRMLLVFKTESTEVGRLVATLFADINGRVNTAFVDTQLLSATHNDWQKLASLIVVHRLPTSRSGMDRVATFVNSPTQWINAKRADQYAIQSVANVIGFAQQLDVLGNYPHPGQVSVLPLTSTAPTAGALDDFWAWWARGGKQHVLHHLMTVDLEGFSKTTPRFGLSSSESAMSVSPVEDYLREAIEAEIAPMGCSVVNINRVTDYLNRESRLRTTAAEVRRALVNLGAVHLGQKRIGHAKPNLWSIRDHSRWGEATEAAIADAYVDPAEQSSSASTRPVSAPPPERRASAPQPTRRRIVT